MKVKFEGKEYEYIDGLDFYLLLEDSLTQPYTQSSETLTSTSMILSRDCTMDNIQASYIREAKYLITANDQEKENFFQNKNNRIIETLTIKINNAKFTFKRKNNQFIQGSKEQLEFLLDQAKPNT